MSNPFEKYKQQAAGSGNPFAKYAQQQAEPEPERMAMPLNAAAAAGERLLDLAGNLVQSTGTSAKRGQEALRDLFALDPGVVFGDVDSLKGVGREPDLSAFGYGLDFTSDVGRTEQPGLAELLTDVGQTVEDVSLGYQPDYTIDRALDSPSLETIAGAIAEQGPSALADMLALATTTPGYLLSRGQELAQTRTKNDGGDDKAIPSTEDYLTGLGGAAVSTAIDRYALNKLMPGAGKVASGKDLLKATGAAVGREALTEAAQEGGVEYATETVGTKAGWQPEQAIRRAIGGALIGGPVGGGVRFATGSAEWRAEVRKQLEQDMKANNVDPNSVDIDALLDQAEAISQRPQYTPDAMEQIIGQATGATTAQAPIGEGMNRRDAARARRDVEREYSQLFGDEQAPVLRRSDVEVTEDGVRPINEARPVTTRTGEQAGQAEFAATRAVTTKAQQLGVTLTPENTRIAAREIAADPTADVTEVVRGYSEEGRAAAIRAAELRRKRREADMARRDEPARDYRPGAIRPDAQMGSKAGDIEIDPDLQDMVATGAISPTEAIARQWERTGDDRAGSPRLRQDMAGASRSVPAGVNIGQPGMPRDSVDRISTNQPGGLRGDFIEGDSPAPEQQPPTGRTFDMEQEPPAPPSARIERQPAPEPRTRPEPEPRTRPEPEQQAAEDTDLKEKVARADAEIDALTDDEAEAVAKEAGADTRRYRDPRAALKQMHPDDAIAAIEAVRTRAAPTQPEQQEGGREDQPSGRDSADAYDGNMENTDRTPAVEGTSAPLIRQLRKASTVGEAAAVLKKHMAPAQKFVLSFLLRIKGIKDTPFNVALLTDGVSGVSSAGLSTKDTGDSVTLIRGLRQITLSSSPTHWGRVSNEYGLSEAENVAATFLHELVHRATSDAVNYWRDVRSKAGWKRRMVDDLDSRYRADAAGQLDDLTDQLREWLGRDENTRGLTRAQLAALRYAASSPDEMVAEGLSSPVVQEIMSTIPVRSRAGSMWDNFVRVVRDLLSMPKEQSSTSMLDEVLRLGAELTYAQSKGDYRKLRQLAADKRNDNRYFEAGIEDSVTGNDNSKSFEVSDSKRVEGLGKQNKLAAWVRGLAKQEGDAFRRAEEGVAELTEDMAEAGKGALSADSATGENLLMKVWRNAFYSTDGAIRSLAGNFRSDTLKSVADFFHATAGSDAGAGRTFDEAIQSRNKRLNAVDTIVDFMKDNGVYTRDAQQQVIRLVENPSTPRRGAVGEAARRIEAFLAEEHRYLKAAGVELGKVDGYFPREMDMGKVAADPEGFIAAATKAYRQMGLSDKDARESARAYWDATVFGASGKPGWEPPSGQTPSFVQGRVFTPEAAKHLTRFRVTDIDAVLGQYTVRATKRAEVARRFGDNWADWADLEARILEEDPSAATVLPVIRDLVATSAGVRTDGMGSTARHGLSWLRTWTTLATLPKAAIASVGELIMAPMRATTGKPDADIMSHLGNLIGHFEAVGRKVLPSLSYEQQQQQLRDLAEDVGIIAGIGHNSLMAARFAGGDPVGRVQSKVLAGFFRNNLLEQLTNYTRMSSMKTGMVFMRRLARDMEANADRAGVFLRELGVPKGKEAEFAEYVRKFGDDLPTKEMVPDSGMGGLYRTALQRFTDQTVMRPSNSTKPKWASHPLGAVVFQLQAFGYAFQKNVLNRQVRLLKNGNWSGADRALYSASAVTSIALLVGLQGMVRYWRDELFSEDVNERKTTGAFIEGAMSQAGLFGVADPYLQSLGSVRYTRSALSSLTGPAIGGVGAATDQLITSMLMNSENTNTAERNMVKATYDWMVEPALQAALTFAPYGPLSGKAVSAATIYGAPSLRDPVTDLVAGEADKAKRKPPITSTFEFLFGDGATPPKKESRYSRGRSDRGRDYDRTGR